VKKPCKWPWETAPQWDYHSKLPKVYNVLMTLMGHHFFAKKFPLFFVSIFKKNFDKYQLKINLNYI
jgi:hypothetical protein